MSRRRQTLTARGAAWQTDAGAPSTRCLQKHTRRLARLSPAAAFEAQQRGAVLVDIRPQASHDTEGELPGAVIVERTVLEWRLDPSSPHRLPIAAYGLQVVIVCNAGYSSSPGAASVDARTVL